MIKIWNFFRRFKLRMYLLSKKGKVIAAGSGKKDEPVTVKEGDTVKADQVLTNNPNVGGFGQAETEVVLQNPARIQGLLAFFVTILLAQVFLVIKKKQFEKVQLAEMNF